MVSIVITELKILHFGTQAQLFMKLKILAKIAPLGSRPQKIFTLLDHIASTAVTNRLWIAISEHFQTTGGIHFPLNPPSVDKIQSQKSPKILGHVT